MALVKAGAIFFTVLIASIAGFAGAAVYLYMRAIWPKSFSDTDAILLTGLLGAFIAFLALAAAIWGVISARAIARRQTTFQHLAAMEVDGSLETAQQTFNRIVREGNLLGYAEKEKEGTPDHQHILTILNSFELISVGIQRGIIEPEFYTRWYKSQVLWSWKNSQSFIVALRARVNSPSLYHEFEEMARWMSDDKIPHRRFWWTGII